MPHILIIEDDNSLRDMLATVLRAEGYTVAEAIDGRDGVDKHREQPADLVLTDVIMPRMDGLETIGALRRATPDLAIVAMSGTTECGLYLRMSELLGAHWTLPKPFSRMALLEAVGKALAAASNRPHSASPVRPDGGSDSRGGWPVYGT